MSLIIPGLWLGSRADAKALLAKEADGGAVPSILSFSNDGAREPESGKHLRLTLADSSEADLGPVLGRALRFIHLHLDGGVLVHCHRGVSRSPAIVCAYLMCAKGLPLREALSLLVSRREQVAPNVHFVVQLKMLEPRRKLLAQTIGIDPDRSWDAPTSPGPLCSDPQDGSETPKRRGRIFSSASTASSLHSADGRVSALEACCSRSASPAPMSPTQLLAAWRRDGRDRLSEAKWGEYAATLGRSVPAASARSRAPARRRESSPPRRGRSREASGASRCILGPGTTPVAGAAPAFESIDSAPYSMPR